MEDVFLEHIHGVSRWILHFIVNIISDVKLHSLLTDFYIDRTIKIPGTFDNLVLWETLGKTHIDFCDIIHQSDSVIFDRIPFLYDPERDISVDIFN